jgi:DNA-binding MarR family transcriptional regulator
MGIIVVKSFYDSVNPRAPSAPRPLLGALLRIPSEEIHRRIIDGLHELGFDDLALAHLAVIRWPGPEGQRPRDLAAQTGMSRQALNYLLGQLETLGYLQRRNDPDDLRSKRIHLTDRGRALVPAVRGIVGKIEREWASELGADDVEQLRDLLDRLVGVIQNGHR